MAKKADKKLLRAVLEPRKEGALRQIAESCAAGADPNSICPECSTSSGYVRGGSTLLTHSIHQSASNAVEQLLQCGADPNLTDQNGWSPWMASTASDESKRNRVQKLLTEHGAEKSGEHIGQLVRVIFNGRVDDVDGLVESDQDFEILSSFRVDMVGHQIGTSNAAMLELLLERGMSPTSTHLLNAIRGRDPSSVDILLRFGFPPEEPDEEETPLMVAAGMGELKIVQLLVAAGADVNRSADGSGEWTASFYAKKAGAKKVVDWLVSQMNDEHLKKQHQLTEARDPKFRKLYEHATAGESLSTDEIVAVLKRWDEVFGVSVDDAGTDRVTISFSSLPENLDELYEEIYEVSPDVCEMKDELLKELRKNKTLMLWWD